MNRNPLMLSVLCIYLSFILDYSIGNAVLAAELVKNKLPTQSRPEALGEAPRL